MFQDLDKMLQGSMAPYKEMIEVQTEMLERLTRQQIECTQACMQATVQQAMELQKAGSPQELTKLQIEYTRKLEEMVTHANQQNINTLQKAHQTLREISLNSLDTK